MLELVGTKRKGFFLFSLLTVQFSVGLFNARKNQTYRHKKHRCINYRFDSAARLSDISLLFSFSCLVFISCWYFFPVFLCECLLPVEVQGANKEFSSKKKCLFPAMHIFLYTNELPHFRFTLFFVFFSFLCNLVFFVFFPSCSCFSKIV